jgi:hypothetical protein
LEKRRCGREIAGENFEKRENKRNKKKKKLFE